MGIWNETCFLSNLPIEPGDPVRLYLLERELNPQQVGNYSYCNEIYKPVLRLSGKYNAYGGVECNEDPNYYKARELYKTRISDKQFEEFLEHLRPVSYTGSVLKDSPDASYKLFGNLCHASVELMAMELGRKTNFSCAPSQLESVIDFMTATRKAFGPTSGAGSQSTHYRIYGAFFLFLANETLRRHEKEKDEERKGDSDWDEDEDWDDINETEGAED